MGWMESLPNPVRAVKKVLRVTTTLKEDNARERRLRASEEGLLLESRIGHVIELALETGMRRGEICNIKPEHIRRNTLLIPETKTGKPRTIPLSVRAREILGSQPGFEYRPRTLSRIFLEVCRANGIEDLRFHDLRHEATSRFFEKGLSIEQVALITGHTDWRSLRRYTHLDPAEIAKKL
jgi:integrase